ncbi:hypothetical protein [Deinococcus indicus]|nr:hypothetical protein [Deinococcus indicus]
MDQADDELGLTAARAARDEALGALLEWGRAHTAQLLRVFGHRFTGEDRAALDALFTVHSKRRELGEMLLRLRVAA